MMNGRNNGKKLMAVRIVAHAFEIVRPSKALTSSDPHADDIATDPHHDRPKPYPNSGRRHRELRAA